MAAMVATATRMYQKKNTVLQNKFNKYTTQTANSVSISVVSLSIFSRLALRIASFLYLFFSLTFFAIRVAYAIKLECNGVCCCCCISMECWKIKRKVGSVWLCVFNACLLNLPDTLFNRCIQIRSWFRMTKLKKRER